MNHQQFQEEEPSRSQRMTEDEAKAVIGLWQEERTEQDGFKQLAVGIGIVLCILWLTLAHLG